jgi:outer membrane receptor protein involved in Fe transport
LPALTIIAYLSYLDRIYAPDATFKRDIKLKPVLDIGGNAEYQIVPRLGAFLQVNNILNNDNERWYGYPVLGLNIFGGLRLKF